MKVHYRSNETIFRDFNSKRERRSSFEYMRKAFEPPQSFHRRSHDSGTDNARRRMISLPPQITQSLVKQQKIRSSHKRDL